MDAFWKHIEEQLKELESAKNADDVIRILASDDCSEDAFFAGSGGDGTVMESLLSAGWWVVWAESSYFYTMQAPDGSMITYIEGDICRGNRR
jgi:hypothetical protein